MIFCPMESICTEMFGPFNFTIVYNDCLFVFFEDIIWEKDVKDPDFDWLEEQLKNSGDFRYRFVFSIFHHGVGGFQGQ